MKILGGLDVSPSSYLVKVVVTSGPSLRMCQWNLQKKKEVTINAISVEFVIAYL